MNLLDFTLCLRVFAVKLIFPLQIVANEFDHSPYLVFRQLIFEGRHREFAFFYLEIDFLFALFCRVAVSQTRDYFAVNFFAVCLRAVADRAVLAKDRGFVRFAVGNDIYRAFCFGRLTGKDERDK